MACARAAASPSALACSAAVASLIRPSASATNCSLLRASASADSAWNACFSSASRRSSSCSRWRAGLPLAAQRRLCGRRLRLGPAQPLARPGRAARPARRPAPAARPARRAGRPRRPGPSPTRRRRPGRLPRRAPGPATTPGPRGARAECRAHGDADEQHLQGGGVHGDQGAPGADRIRAGAPGGGPAADPSAERSNGWSSCRVDRFSESPRCPIG